MVISTKGRYALRLMIDLAQHCDDGFISLKWSTSDEVLFSCYESPGRRVFTGFAGLLKFF